MARADDEHLPDHDPPAQDALDQDARAQDALAQDALAQDALTRSRADAAEWDERYRTKPAFWSGNPNGTFVQEVSPLPPGRALDVGCGEGADAIWLAQRGWAVTAVDISAAAIDRARAAGRDAGVEVDWRAEDVLLVAPAAAAYDLVTIQYPALLRSAGPAAARALLDAVAPGGVLLLVGHALDHGHGHDHAREHGFDPERYVGHDQFLALLSAADFEVEVDETRPRPSPPPGAVHVDDTVLRARRRG